MFLFIYDVNILRGTLQPYAESYYCGAILSLRAFLLRCVQASTALKLCCEC